MIYDEKMFEAFVGRDANYNSEAREEAHITEADLQQIIRIIVRISRDYNCGVGSGFTWEESQLAEIIRQVYECGRAAGRQDAFRELRWKLEAWSKD